VLKLRYMSKSTRQNKLREKLLKAYPDFPVDKLSQVLSTIADYKCRFGIGPVVSAEYNKDSDCILFSVNNFIRKTIEIRIEVEKNLGTDESKVDFFLNGDHYTSFSCTSDLEATRRVCDIISEVTTKPKYTDSEVLEIVEKIQIANSLAKTDPENKSFLYGVKHDFLKYVILCHSDLIEYIKPMTPEDDEHRKLLEIKIGDNIFHVPYDKQKARYGFIWTTETQPDVFRKEEPRPLPDNLDVKSLEIELANIYIKMSGGKPTNMAPGAIKYWWTREVLRKKYNNPDLRLIRATGRNNKGHSDYNAQDGIKYKMINGDTTAENQFITFFMEAVRSGIKL
jgi:hypothetical protein